MVRNLSKKGPSISWILTPCAHHQEFIIWNSMQNKVQETDITSNMYSNLLLWLCAEIRLQQDEGFRGEGETKQGVMKKFISIEEGKANNTTFPLHPKHDILLWIQTVGKTESSVESLSLCLGNIQVPKKLWNYLMVFPSRKWHTKLQGVNYGATYRRESILCTFKFLFHSEVRTIKSHCSKE